MGKVVMVDMGHDSTVIGKSSPDHQFHEWEFNRDIGRRIIAELCARGIDARPTTGPDEDHKNIYLTTRAKRVNAVCDEVGVQDVIFVSIHSNACGDGSAWMAARGWSVYVSCNSSQNSKLLASDIYDAAEANGFKMRKPKPDQKYWEDNFTVLIKTKCPAVLTESLFYDNKDDLAILQSEEGRARLVKAHVEGIIKYLSR